MFLLFESIRYKNGVAENLFFHQQRVNRAFLELGGGMPIDLSNCLKNANNIPNNDDIVYKCKIQYNLTGNVQVSFEPYRIKKIITASIHEMGSHDYQHKYTNRNWINNILLNAGTDEIILTQNGIIKDANYANLVFFDGNQWITPLHPLLLGTRRDSLLKEGVIKEAEIHLQDLNKFKAVKFMNAMMLWEESPMLNLTNIV